MKEAKQAEKLSDKFNSFVKDNQLDQKYDDVTKTVSGAIKDAKLDEKTAAVIEAIRSIELNKKVAAVADTIGTAVKDAELDKKFATVTETVGDKVKEAELDKKAATVVNTVSDKVKEAELDKKLADVTSTVADKVKDTGLPDKLAAVGDSIGEAVKNAKLDEKLAVVTGAVAGAVKETGLDKKLAEVGDTVSGAVKDAKLDKKFSDLADTVTGTVKDAKLDKKFSNVADTVTGAVKDAKLDKKFNDVTGTVTGAVKDAKLDKKLADVGNTVSDTFKSAQLDKKLQTVGKSVKDAKLDEKLFAAAAVIPGVEIKNPKKAAKNARKQLAKGRKELAKRGDNLTKQGRQLAERYGLVEPPKKKGGFPWKTTLGVSSAAVGGLAYNNYRLWKDVPVLQSVLPGTAHFFNSRTGAVFYKELGEQFDQKPPIVFIHGIGAGASSYTWRENFGVIAKEYHCYAYDLLGFGNSERPAIKYTAETYIQQLYEFLKEVVKEPAYIVASSLSGSYAVQVAYRHPDMIKKLFLVAPTGINKPAHDSGPTVTGRFSYPILRAPILGKSLFSFVASRGSIRNFLKQQLYTNPNMVTDEMVENYYISSHQPGSEYAPPSFFSGLLNAEIGATIGKLEQPVMMVWGRDSTITPVEKANELLEQNRKARIRVFESTKLGVNEEKSAEFNAAVFDFFADQPSSSSDREQTAALG